MVKKKMSKSKKRHCFFFGTEGARRKRNRGGASGQKFTAAFSGYFWPLTLLVNSSMHRQQIFDGIIAHYNLLLSPRLDGFFFF